MGIGFIDFQGLWEGRKTLSVPPTKMGAPGASLLGTWETTELHDLLSVPPPGWVPLVSTLRPGKPLPATGPFIRSKAKDRRLLFTCFVSTPYGLINRLK